MYFSDLLNLPYDRMTEKIDVRALRANMPWVPDDVLDQLFVDHGRNEEFQECYQKLDLDRVDWSLRELDCSSLVECTINEEFRRWYEQVSKRAERFNEEAWNGIDTRPEVCRHWSKNQTWLRPPILLAENLLENNGRMHLMEGHTRVGLLKGLVAHEIIRPDTRHKAWIGAELSR